MTVVSMTSIDTAILDRQLLGAALGNPKSWRVWRTGLKAAFGITLNREEAHTFAAIAGNRAPPTQRVRELWAIVARRGGKSRIAAAVSCYLAVFGSYRLARGEVGVVLVLAATQAQAQTVFNYVLGFLEASPILHQEIDSVTRHEIRLRNGIIIAVHSNSFRTIRGRALVACVMDEVAFWRDVDSATPDIETYRAVLPALATTAGMLIGISTGYRKAGLLYQKHRDFFGVDSPDVLVVQGSTLQFNETLTKIDIAAQRAADPEAAISEWEGGFREDISSFLDDALIEAAIDHGRPLELPPIPYNHATPIKYVAFTDASGGRGDAYAIAIGHKKSDNLIVDLCRCTLPPFDPTEVTRAYADLLRDYHCNKVTGDFYGAEWVSSAWQKENITYARSLLPKSKIYLEALPLFARGLVRLPDHARLIRELRLLERQAHRSGKDTVDQGRNGTDDAANVVCGVLQLLSNRSSAYVNYAAWVGDNLADPNGSSAWQSLRTSIYLNSGGAVDINRGFSGRAIDWNRW
jgi:hypothetical protein